VTFGERLRELRAERQLSLRQVKERGGPNKDTMSLLERGVHSPHAQTLGRIAQAFGMSVAELRTELDAAQPPPLGQAPPSPEQPPLNGFEEERRANWRSAVNHARRLREGSRAQLEELLAAWQASRERGELRSARRGSLDEIAQLFNNAYGATHALVDILVAEGGIPAEDDWEEVRAADTFYRTLIKMMRNAGFVIRERKSEPPEVEEPDAA
jgi:transcriptional regulator with XRE-family HTH domain